MKSENKTKYRASPMLISCSFYALRQGSSRFNRSLFLNLCLFLPLLLGACANTGTQKTGASCSLVKAVSLPAIVTPNRQILIPVGINGTTVFMIVDTGADATVLFADAARRLGLEPKNLIDRKIRGFNGETSLYEVSIDHFNLGKMIQGDRSFKMAVVETPQAHPGPYVAGLMGGDYLKHFDLEFDLADKTVNLFLHHPCDGQAAYWPHEVLLQTKFSFGSAGANFISNNHVMIPIEINGKTGSAALDSGAFATAMTWRDAHAFGITAETEGVKTGRGMHGIGDKTVESSEYVIPSVQLGNETIVNMLALIYKPVREHPDREIELGVDFLLKNRVYIAYDEREIYFMPYRYKLAAPSEAAPAQ